MTSWAGGGGPAWTPSSCKHSPATLSCKHSQASSASLEQQPLQPSGKWQGHGLGPSTGEGGAEATLPEAAAWDLRTFFMVPPLRGGPCSLW